MKTILNKILLIFIFIINIAVISNAMNIKLENTYNEINAGDEVIYELEIDEKIMTVDFEIEYDKEILEFKGISTPNVEYNKIEDGKLIVLYVGEENQGIDKIEIIFAAKNLTKESQQGTIKIKNVSMFSLEEKSSYEFDIKWNKFRFKKNKNISKPSKRYNSEL